ncbi:MAG: LysR substrate-binding domain-containing protein, partial [Pseudomonadota bacterium]
MLFISIMELRHLKYFVAVAEEMNMHRAAERLNVSQPPLSVAIKQLESEIGTDLFKREKRGISITRAGESFLVQARQILAHADSACAEAKAIGEGVEGTLKIGFVSSAVTGIFQDTVYAFRRQHKNVTIITNQSVNKFLVPDLLSKKIDIGISRYPESYPENINVKKMTKESWVVALSKDHPLIKKQEIQIKDFEGHCLHFYPRWNGPTGYDEVANLFKEHNVAFDPVVEVTEQTAIAGLVASGRGLAVVPECMQKLKFPRLTHRPLIGAEDKTGFAFLSRKEDDVIVEKFISIAQKLVS